MKTFFSIIFLFLISISCIKIRTSEVSHGIDKNNKTDELAILSLDSIKSFMVSVGLNDTNKLVLIDSNTIAISSYSLPTVFVFNEKGKFLNHRPCNAEFPGLVEYNIKAWENMEVLNLPYGKELLNCLKNQNVDFKPFNIVYSIVPTLSEIEKDRIEKQLLPLLEEAKDYQNVQVIQLISCNHEDLNLSKKRYKKLNSRQNFWVFKKLGLLPKDYAKDSVKIFSN